MFADEPTGSLDSLTGEQVMDLLVDTAREQGTTVVLVTHEARVAAYADREVVVRDGQVTLTPGCRRDPAGGPPDRGRRARGRWSGWCSPPPGWRWRSPCCSWPRWCTRRCTPTTSAAPGPRRPRRTRSRRRTSATTDPLLWRLTEVRFDGRDVVRVDLAAEGPDAPVPAGPGRAARPGRDSPCRRALAELLDDTDPAHAGRPLPGGRVTATVGRDALASPEDLVVFVGHAARRAAGASRTSATVRSIEAAPISRNLTRAMRIVFAVGGVGLLAPVVVFVATATRLAATRREQRLAALRLAGATSGQVGRGRRRSRRRWPRLVGVAAGFGLFFAVRPRLARVPIDGASFYPSDLRLSIGLGARRRARPSSALAVGAAIVSLRRVRISPLGVARRAHRPRPSARPLLLVAAGMAGLAVAVVWDRRSPAGRDARSRSSSA